VNIQTPLAAGDEDANFALAGILGVYIYIYYPFEERENRGVLTWTEGPRLHYPFRVADNRNLPGLDSISLLLCHNTDPFHRTDP
jgi:hypothetical protein